MNRKVWEMKMCDEHCKAGSLGLSCILLEPKIRSCIKENEKVEV